MSKKLVFLTSFILVLGLIPSNIAKGVDPALLCWWKFDDKSGSTASDSSGNGRDGTLMGNPQWVDGYYGGALNFGGDGDHVVDADAGNYLTGLEAVTVCVWIKSNVTNTDKGFVCFLDPAGGDDGGMRYDAAGYQAPSAKNMIKLSLTTTGGNMQLEGSDNTQTTEWQHVSLVWSSGNELKLYVNGELNKPAYTQTRSGTISATKLIVGKSVKDVGAADGWNGLVDDVRIYSRALTKEEIKLIMKGPPGLASHPNPDDTETDVPRDVVLSWTPGEFAPPTDGHEVYFSENFNDVNDGIGGIVQDANSYAPPQRLNFGTTYYWRVNEVNGPPDFTVYKGNLWSFTTELFAYPVEDVTATASSSEVAKGPENTVNGSGLDDSGLLHGKDGDDNMWLSGTAGPQPTWIQYEFDKAYKLHEMWVWNSNEGLEPVLGFGFKDVTIEYSTNGTDYAALGTTHQFARAPGMPGYAHNTTIDFGGVAAKYVKLTANSNWGGILKQYGLSEVRFFYIPVNATKPYPQSGSTGVKPDVVLSWKAGREAAKHNVYVSTDEQTVIDGTAPVATVAEASYGPLSLDLNVSYYWKVNEVNEAETPSTWASNIWSFTTSDHIVVDDFESYNDLDTTDPKSNRIFNTWIDGYGVPINGSIVGYENPPFTEQTIVHGGRQSMPLSYSNTDGAAYSEAERTFVTPQNWTESGVKTLAIFFYGTAGNTGQLYVKVNGTKVVYGGDAGDIAKAQWNRWNIDLVSVGVNLQSVTKLAVGIDGNGAAGKLYFDDIRLY